MTTTQEQPDKRIKFPHNSILFNGEPINSICINFDAYGYEHEEWDFVEKKPNHDWNSGPGKAQAYLLIETSKSGTHVRTAHNYGTPLQSSALNWDLNEDYKEGDPTFDYISIRFSDHGFLRIRWLTCDIETGDTKLWEEYAINIKHVEYYEINTESDLDAIKSNKEEEFKK